MVVTPTEENNFEFSKTQLKKQMLKLQNIGKRLTKISENERKKLQLPIDLEEAIILYAKIKSNEAGRRQLQFIGRIMRTLDLNTLNTITTYFSVLDGEHQEYNSYLQRLEKTRNLLINDPNALTDYIKQHPEIDATHLRTLIRNHKKEFAHNQPPKSYREIFKLLKEIEPFNY